METNAAVAARGGLLHRQFDHPSGLLGALIGVAMAIEHKELHRAVIERLDLDSTDRVLELGFGPGTAIRLAAARASFVAGVEPSREMIRQAARRNRAAIQGGRVELLRASASAIPYPDDSFTAVFEVNSFHHWERPEAGLREIYRVLKPGGRLLMVLNGPHGHSVNAEAERVVRMLNEAGFNGIQQEENRFGHGGAFVSARR